MKILLLTLTVASIGTAGYFITRKSNKQLKLLILARVNNATDRQRMSLILDRMTRQELLDTYRMMQYSENTPKSVIDKLGPSFKARVMAIGSKYNIFT